MPVKLQWMDWQVERLDHKNLRYVVAALVKREGLKLQVAAGRQRLVPTTTPNNEEFEVPSYEDHLKDHYLRKIREKEDERHE